MESPVSLSDLERAVGDAIPEEDRAYAEGLIEEATALVQAWARALPADPAKMPGSVRLVIARAAARAYVQATTGVAGASQFSRTAGPFTQSFSYAEGTTDGGPWLTKADKLILRRWRGGAYTVQCW